MTNYRHLNSILGEEFDRYVMEHPAFAARIPRGAEVVLQLADNPGFSSWQRRVWKQNHEPGRAVVLVTVRKLRPERSRLVAPRLRKIAAA
jgi:hypothetical protein